MKPVRKKTVDSAAAVVVAVARVAAAVLAVSAAIIATNRKRNLGRAKSGQKWAASFGMLPFPF